MIAIQVHKRKVRIDGKSRVFTAKQGWHEINAKKYFFRSNWEKQYAYYLEWLRNNNVIKAWEHEPEVFWFNEIKRGVRSYCPDFKITNPDGSHYWVEVKGYMDAKSKTKIRRFRKYYPQEKLVIIDKEWFEKNYGKKS
jgi:hypothetical protein